MMSNRSVELFHKAHESFEKFDYFICGVSGALFAYVGQHYVPQKFHLGAPALEPLSLACFVVSFFVGLRRIETTAHSKRLNALMLDAAEKAGALLKALAGGGKGPYLNIEGGTFQTNRL